MRKLTTGFLAILLVAMPQLLQAITMRAAIGEALSNNHNLKAAAFENSAAEFKIKASRASFFPQLLFEEAGVYTNSATKSLMMRLDEGRLSLAGDLNHPTASGDFRTALLLEQPLFDLRIGSALAAAKKEQEKSGLAMQRRREEVAYQTVSAYLDVQRNKTKLQLAEYALRDAREHQRLAVVRSGAGVGLRSDELRARTYVSEMEQQLISAGNNVEIARLRLALAVGRAPGEKLDISGEYQAPSLKWTEAELLQRAFLERAELKEKQASVEQAELGLASARNGYWPTAHAVGAYQMNDHATPFGRENDAWAVGATLRWEIFSGGRSGNETDRAAVLKSSAQEYLAEQRQEVGLQVTESYLRREALGKRLEVARHAVLEAEEGVRLLSRRFENSLALMVELLDSQTMLNRARGDVAENEAEYTKAWVRLLFVSGILLKEMNNE